MSEGERFGSKLGKPENGISKENPGFSGIFTDKTAAAENRRPNTVCGRAWRWVIC
jgi:hypothetical protein